MCSVSAITFLDRDVDTDVTVFSGCFRKLTQTAIACCDFDRIRVIPCGERWPDGTLRPAIEDYAAAGGIIAVIGRDRCSPEAEGAVAPGSSLTCHLFANALQPWSFNSVDVRRMLFCLKRDRTMRACQLQGDFYASGLGRS